MIKHIVSWKIAAEDADTRSEHATQIVAKLQSLVGVVPSIRALSVGSTVVDGPNHWDLGLIVDFDDEAGLQAYQDNPDHRAVAAFIRSVISQQATVDFLS
ncbi:Dabb family protein [Glaciihabitans sp. UYNi722]|uniref:Dabb family protein n=1 Tax=Glaciihabitans sp. UYNi722 TaxID=3156344 RepID=UPI00339A14C5